MTSDPNPDISNYYESICYANAKKEDKSEKIGLVVKRSNAWDTLYISSIKDTSKFASSKLEVGMVILTINGMKCPKTVKEIQQVMKETEGDLTIMAATISKEISIIGSNANSPTNSPVRRTSDARVVTLADGGPEMDDEPQEYPLSFRTKSYVPGKDDTTNIVTPQFPQHHLNKSSDLTASTADINNSEHPASESLEMTLSGHQNSSQDAPHPVSPPESPGSSPLPNNADRKVSDSGIRRSPVYICTIDHTGNIVVTPKQDSPKNKVSRVAVPDDVKMPNLSRSVRSEEEEEEEKKAEVQLDESSAYDDDESDAKPSASPTSAFAAVSKTQQQQQHDDRAKKRAARPPRMAPAVEPGAYHVPTKRPIHASKVAHSLSPVPRRSGAQRAAGMNGRVSEPVIPTLSSLVTTQSAPVGRSVSPRHSSASPTPRRQSSGNSPPPHPDNFVRPGAQRVDGPNRRPAGAMALPSKQGYVPASASSPPAAEVSPSNNNAGGPVDVDALENDGVLQGIGVGMGVPIGAVASVDGDLSKEDDLDYIDDDGIGSIEVSEAPEMSIITSDDLVIAAEVQEHPEILEEKIRQQILQQTAQASVVMVEHGGKSASDDNEEELEMHKPKNVKEKLFGGGGKGRDVSQELDINPDEFIRKREHLPWTVTKNETTGMWIASVVTDQKAYDDGNKTEQERSKVIFSAKTEREAHETGLAMATPYLQPFKNHPICVMCSNKFAVFSKPHNCRNCGVVVCSKCTVVWSSKRLPPTYQTSKSTHSVCMACDWSANSFEDAIMQGNLQKAKKLYESGNVNLRSPCISSAKKKSGQEIMHPIHMAILGGNVDLARWMCKERFVPVTTEVKTRGAAKSVPLGTSKGRTPLKLAIKQKNHDMLKFLVAEMEVSLFDEDIKGDFRYILAHLSNTLHRAPYEADIDKKAKRQVSSSGSQASNPPNVDARVEYASSGSISVGTHQTQGSNSRADSRGEC